MRSYSVRASSFLNVCLALGAVGVIAVGCADEQANPAAAGKGGSSSAGKGGGGGGSVGEGGAVSTGGGPSGIAVTYEVPTSGGTVEVELPSGDSVSFEFPASAQGETITLTPD